MLSGLQVSGFRYGFLASLLAWGIVGCAVESPEEASPRTVIVLAAASTKDALQAIAREAERTSPVPLKIEISTGPSHALAQQILSGAPADIYVSANRQWADEVDQAGLAAKSIDWLGNQLVLIVPTASTNGIGGLEDLTSEKVERIAIAGTSVPAGIYAEEALKYHKHWTPLEEGGKLVRGHDVRSTLAYAERGEVDAAIVYATDALLTEKVKVVARFAPTSHAPIVYPLVRIQTEEASPAADQFFTFLQSDAARQIAQRFGFVAFGKPNGEAH